MMIVHKENLVDRKELNICVPIYIWKILKIKKKPLLGVFGFNAKIVRIDCRKVELILTYLKLLYSIIDFVFKIINYSLWF
jgi:hypothetical protein